MIGRIISVESSLLLSSKRCLLMGGLEWDLIRADQRRHQLTWAADSQDDAATMRLLTAFVNTLCLVNS